MIICDNTMVKKRRISYAKTEIKFMDFLINHNYTECKSIIDNGFNYKKKNNHILKFLIDNKLNDQFKWLLSMNSLDSDDRNYLYGYSLNCMNLDTCLMLTDMENRYMLIQKFIDNEDSIMKIIGKNDPIYYFNIALQKDDLKVCMKLHKLYNIELTLEMLKQAVIKSNKLTTEFIFRVIKLDKKGYFFEWLIKNKYETTLKILLTEVFGDYTSDEVYETIIEYAIHEELDGLLEWIFDNIECDKEQLVKIAVETAIRNGNLEKAILLTNKFDFIKIRHNYGLFDMAVIHKQSKIIEWLFEENSKDFDSLKAENILVRSRNNPISFKWLIENKIQLHTHAFWQMMTWAVRNITLDFIRNFYKIRQFDIHYEDEILFRLSCDRGYFDFAKWLYELDCVNIRAKNDSAFKSALQHEDGLQMIRWMYSIDKNINIRHDAILERLCNRNDKTLATWIVSKYMKRKWPIPSEAKFLMNRINNEKDVYVREVLMQLDYPTSQIHYLVKDPLYDFHIFSVLIYENLFD